MARLRKKQPPAGGPCPRRGVRSGGRRAAGRGAEYRPTGLRRVFTGLSPVPTGLSLVFTGIGPVFVLRGPLCVRPVRRPAAGSGPGGAR